MMISSSTVSLFGKSKLTQEYSREESLRYWVGSQQADTEGEGESGKTGSSTVTQNNTSTTLISSLSSSSSVSGMELNEDGDMEASLSSRERIALKVAETLLNQVTGKRVKLDIGKIKVGRGSKNKNASGSATQQAGWGLEYRMNEKFVEKETASFNAVGIVKTSDGKKVNLDINMNLSREFVEQHDINITAGEAQLMDPLVINIDAPAATLTDAKFDFDLDSDGNMDSISFTGTGSGFLAIDSNQNGVIDNGSELFGPATGNGFSELSAYDGDGNMWIDEADAAYNNMRIWMKEDGEDKLYSLQEKGIGAIYLGTASLDFTLKDSSNQTAGVSRYAGIYLKENGQAGTVQQVDLAV